MQKNDIHNAEKYEKSKEIAKCLNTIYSNPSQSDLNKKYLKVRSKVLKLMNNTEVIKNLCAGLKIAILKDQKIKKTRKFLNICLNTPGLTYDYKEFYLPYDQQSSPDIENLIDYYKLSTSNLIKLYEIVGNSNLTELRKNAYKNRIKLYVGQTESTYGMLKMGRAFNVFYNENVLIDVMKHDKRITELPEAVIRYFMTCDNYARAFKEYILILAKELNYDKLQWLLSQDMIENVEEIFDILASKNFANCNDVALFVTKIFDKMPNFDMSSQNRQIVFDLIVNQNSMQKLVKIINNDLPLLLPNLLEYVKDNNLMETFLPFECDYLRKNSTSYQADYFFENIDNLSTQYVKYLISTSVQNSLIDKSEQLAKIEYQIKICNCLKVLTTKSASQSLKNALTNLTERKRQIKSSNKKTLSQKECFEIINSYIKENQD